MIAKIRTHIMDLLAADARLYRSGNAYAPGFLGVKRMENGVDLPTQGYVNLYDDVFEVDADDTCPGVYAGHQGNEGADELDFQAIAGNLCEFRTYKLPLVIIAHGTSKKDARQQRDQLLANVTYILWDRNVEAGFWWWMDVPGAKAGGDMRKSLFSSATGGASQGAYPSGCILPLEIHYSVQRGGTDA